jgi:hypothetical protein
MARGCPGPGAGRRDAAPVKPPTMANGELRRVIET